MGSGLKHALPDVLRVLQLGALGDDRRDVAMGQLPTRLSYNSLDCSGLRRFLRALPSIFHGQNWLGNHFERASNLPRVPARQGLALWGCNRDARAAGDRGCRGVYAGAEAIWGLGKLR